MGLSKEELIKIYSFLLENEDIIIEDKGLFNKNILVEIDSIIKGKRANGFKLTKEQENLIINLFLGSESVFNEYTPSFVLENFECIKVALQRDINSANYIINIDPDLESYVINKALEKHLVLKSSSPDFLKNNYLIALTSITQDVLSANFVDWNSMSEEESQFLINKIIEKEYILSSNSPSFLRSNLQIVLSSIKKDINSVDYSLKNIKNHPEVFKYLILNGYEYDNYYIEENPLYYFSDKDVLTHYLKEIGYYYDEDENDKKYIERFNKIYGDIINIPPTIKMFDSIFQFVAEKKWSDYRYEESDDYNNISGRICAQLRDSKSLIKAIENLCFMKNMKILLGKKFDILYEAMADYFNIFHSTTANKLDKLEGPKNKIVELSSLYIAKSKENYKKEVLNELYKWLKPNFTLRLENSYINKKLVEVKKKEEFVKLYINNNEDICKFINNIIYNYSKVMDYKIICEMIKSFILNNNSDFEKIISPPAEYLDYIRYEKALKLIHRLNKGYINYDDIEVFNYKDIIELNNGEYIYTGKNFNELDISIYSDYRKKEQIFKSIKKEIMQKIKTLDISNLTILNESIVDEVPFTDDYFKFDSQKVLSDLKLKNLIKYMSFNFEENVFINNETFRVIYNLLVNNGLIWLSLFETNNPNFDLEDIGINDFVFFEIINNMGDIISIAKNFNFDLNNYEELIFVNEMREWADDESIAILDKKIIGKLCEFSDYVISYEREIISVAKELICEMAKRDRSTVPYISGQTLDYKYSLYDHQDETILVSGIDTDSCFKVKGIDNDFFHYCALDKNGFVIKITDSSDKFIARASGFRNGNCVFINQLRSIYDEGGEPRFSKYLSDRNDIIEVFKKACEDIVSISQNNKYEKNKIDFVFVTQSYVLSEYCSNVSDIVAQRIGCDPMDTTSDDWDQFMSNTNNLDSNSGFAFQTDYGNYPLICMASSKSIRSIKSTDLKLKDVPALYERKRNQIIITNNIDDDVLRKVNKIKAINSFFDITNFERVNISSSDTVFIGDNWYIIYNDGTIVDSCILYFDENAEKEAKATLEIINNNQIENINNEDILCKVLKFNKGKK